MEEALIREVAKFPWIFDPKHKSYKDMFKKKNTWMDITAALGLPATEGKQYVSLAGNQFIKSVLHFGCNPEVAAA